MKTATVHVFSGTGNSAHAARVIVPPHAWALAALIHIALYCLAVALLDPLAAAMERLPVVRHAFRLSWTGRFRRYLAPGFRRQD